LAEKLGPRNREYRDTPKADGLHRFSSLKMKIKGKNYNESPSWFRGRGRYGSPGKRDNINVGYIWADFGGGSHDAVPHYVSQSDYNDFKKARKKALASNKVVYAKQRASSLLAARRQSRMKQDQARAQAARGKRAAYASLLSGYDSGGIG